MSNKHCISGFERLIRKLSKTPHQVDENILSVSERIRLTWAALKTHLTSNPRPVSIKIRVESAVVERIEVKNDGSSSLV
jgi:hypothetical protein